MKIKEVELKIIKGDITELAVDAIVSSADTQLTMNRSLAAAIKEKAGPSVAKEALERAPIMVGDAVWTRAGELKAHYIIHAATKAPGMETHEAIVRQATANALKCAAGLELESIAFPALACGVGKFSPVGAAKIMVQEVLKYLKRQKTTLQEIIFCLLDDEMFRTFEQTASGYVHHIQDTLGEGPYITVDAIIEMPEGIVLIERSNPPYGWALPGGFVDYGESLEKAVCREAKEETNLELIDLRQFHTYSEPDRDPRFHTVTTVFVAKGKGTPKSGDDAKGLTVVKYSELLNRDYAFDHNKVIGDYLKAKEKED